MTAVAAIAGRVPNAPEPLHRALRRGGLGEFRAISDFAACLMPLLAALDWRGEPRHVAESIPHFANSLDLVGLRNTLAYLNYTSRPGRLSLAAADPMLAPFLFVPRDGAAVVVLRIDGTKAKIFDGGANRIRTIDVRGRHGTAYFFDAIESDGAQSNAQDRGNWFQTIARRFRGLVGQILITTFFLNVVALSVPIFIMLIYDKVVGTGSLSTLAYLGSGVVILLASEAAFRLVRAKMLAFIGARIDMIVGTAVFQHLLHLPPVQTERATIGAQVSRMKEFESLREFFTSPLALVFLELPFAALFVAVIAIIAGPVALVPVVVAGLFALTGVMLNPLVRRSVAASSRASATRHNLLVETLSNMRAIKYTNSEAAWLRRYSSLSSAAAAASFKTAQLASLVQTLAHVLMLGAGVATLAFGILHILDGHMTAGALIATMALVWRVLAPMQTFFVTVTKLEQVRNGVRQINALLRIPPERDPYAAAQTKKRLPGRVTFSRVSLRYTAESEPALVGASFDVMPGEVIAIIGPNGSGKSTILKLITGLYQPQAGGVRIDGLDIRQLDPIELRKMVAYVPQSCHLFHGTVAQNLRLADPTATDAELEEVARQANVLDDVLALPEGFETRIGDQAMRRLPAGLRQRLSLARAYLKKAPIILFDEPGNTLDGAGDRAFLAQLDALRGRATVFMVTHRPSHMKKADRIIVLDSGFVRAVGPAGEILTQLPEDFL